MSHEQFLARWSRRKHEAKADHAEPASEKAEAQGSGLSDSSAAEPVAGEPELSKLPPIESIDAAADITAFLREGIPQELSRAALRRAWSVDPAIHDFVGLAENAWNFNDPNAMAGFGPLNYSAEQVDALVRRIVGGMREPAESLPNPLEESAAGALRPPHAETDFAQSSDPAKAVTDSRPFEVSAAAELSSSSAASQPVAADEETTLPRRTHGGALPR